MLTDLKLKALKPRDALYRVADAHGLCIEVTPTGSKLWRYRYRYAGLAKMLALGPWPLVSLASARLKRDDARRLLLDKIDPMAKRRRDGEQLRQAQRGMFETVAKEWLDLKRKSVSEETYRKAKLVTESDLIPALRRHNIGDLATKDVTPVLLRIADRAPHLAQKARQYLGGIVDYAIKQGLRDDGRLLSLKGAVPKFEKGHISAVTKPSELGPLLRAIEEFSSPLTRAALKLAALTAMRPGIVASARWEHIDLERAEWHVPGHLMKMRHAHIVPLQRQAIELLRELEGHDRVYVFPSPAKQKTPHVHRDSLSKALRAMGFQGKHATHGFRGTLRTMARERLGIDLDVLEAQLAHAKRGDVAKAYDRTTFDDQRVQVMQEWADYLDTVRRNEDNVVPLKKTG